ncbi:hypothetical protein MTER_11040 [Mycolicibacter terrae]|uniref:Acyl-CoA synthase n=1 Tax=Mycolicibacter terrae TaxID=1788 RepID=A0AAD1HW98_9MYCO|nr:hypothetical protein [Mycolicibacter terrae]ORW98062.1 hypothetical protein AWC28_07500 [Mycolicibacter terrae]BBX21693.1 hypothetical protein MTER_11040 [Mycolicibacter terrae]SNV86598.1 Uncharacterised protein [Mycolicibacter terrae]
MTAAEPAATGAQTADQRPDSDDYDLLTFGEVAARLSEELVSAAAELERARNGDSADPDRIRALEERIQLLQTSKDRYRREERSNETFTRRFGSLLRPSADPRPRWT